VTLCRAPRGRARHRPAATDKRDPCCPEGVARSLTQGGPGVAGSVCKRSRVERDRSAVGRIVRAVRDALERATVSCRRSGIS
jgi:hypothetical protein